MNKQPDYIESQKELLSKAITTDGSYTFTIDELLEYTNKVIEDHEAYLIRSLKDNYKHRQESWVIGRK